MCADCTLNFLLYLCLVLRCSLIVLLVDYTCVFWNWLEKLIYVNFSQFSDVSVWSVWTVLLGVRMGMELSRPNRISLRTDTRGTKWLDNQDRRADARDLSAHFWGSTRPDGINTSSRRGPHRLYKRPLVAVSPPYPTKISLFGLLWVISWVILALSYPSLSFCALISHSRYSSSLFFFSLLLTVRMLIILKCFWDYEIHIFATLRLFVILFGTTMW
jgi:hypothetical protein